MSLGYLEAKQREMNARRDIADWVRESEAILTAKELTRKPPQNPQTYADAGRPL